MLNSDFLRRSDFFVWLFTLLLKIRSITASSVNCLWSWTYPHTQKNNDVTRCTLLHGSRRGGHWKERLRCAVEARKCVHGCQGEQRFREREQKFLFWLFTMDWLLVQYRGVCGCGDEARGGGIAMWMASQRHISSKTSGCRGLLITTSASASQDSYGRTLGWDDPSLWRSM